MSFNEEELDDLMNTDFSDARKLVDTECFDQCYLYPLCPVCYGADYMLTKSVSKRDKSICDLMKVRALFSAALHAHRIVDMDLEALTYEEKGKVFKTAVAIRNIKELYGTML